MKDAAKSTLLVLGTPEQICAGDAASWRERAGVGVFTRGRAGAETLDRWLALVERDPDPELRRRAATAVADYAALPTLPAVAT